MTKRQQVLAHMRIAGYNNDTFAFTRLYCENRIKRSVADEAFYAGRRIKQKEKEIERTSTITRYG